MTKPGLEPSNLVSRVAALTNSTQVFKSNQLNARYFYDPPPRVMETKTKINKWDLNKLKSFCTTKEAISKVKRQCSEWEKIIANETTDKELISKTYKQLIQVKTRKTNNPIKKWEKI